MAPLMAGPTSFKPYDRQPYLTTLHNRSVNRSSLLDSPLDSGIVSLLGAIVILYVGVRSVFISSSLGISGLDAIALELGMVTGIVLTVSSIIVIFGTSYTRILGVVIVVFSILSWIGTEGGFTFGFVLCFLGGIMAASWKGKKPSIKSGPTA